MKLKKKKTNMKLSLYLINTPVKRVAPKSLSSLWKKHFPQQLVSTHVSLVLLQNHHLIFQTKNQEAKSAQGTKYLYTICPAKK